MKYIRLAIMGMVLSAIIIAGVYLIRTQFQRQEVTDFASCAAAGYPVQESFPAVCTTPDGQSFTQPVQ